MTDSKVAKQARELWLKFQDDEGIHHHTIDDWPIRLIESALHQSSPAHEHTDSCYSRVPETEGKGKYLNCGKVAGQSSAPTDEQIQRHLNNQASAEHDRMTALATSAPSPAQTAPELGTCEYCSVLHERDFDIGVTGAPCKNWKPVSAPAPTPEPPGSILDGIPEDEMNAIHPEPSEGRKL